MFNDNRGNNQFLYSYSNINNVITPGAHELTEIAELIKEKIDGIVIIEPDKNTRKWKLNGKKTRCN